MKRLILGIIFGVSTLVGFSQAPWVEPTYFQNGQSFYTVRNTINTNFSNGWLRDNRMQDSLERHLVILGTIYGRLTRVNDTLDSHNDRLKALEAYSAGTAYTSSNGITLSANEFKLGGTLTNTTTIITGGSYNFNVSNADVAPSSGTFKTISLNAASDIRLSNVTYALSAITSGGYLTLSPTTGFYLYGKYGIGTYTIESQSYGMDIKFVNSSSPSQNKTVTLSNYALTYGADYSGSFDTRSLVDKGYVDDALASSDIVHLKDTIEVQLLVDNDTLGTGVQQGTGNIFVVGERLDGYILSRAKIYSPDIGDGTISASVHRTRTSQVNMTSTSASLSAATNTPAVINTIYDDVQEGDWIEIKYLDTSTPVSSGLNIVLIFKKP